MLSLLQCLLDKFLPQAEADYRAHRIYLIRLTMVACGAFIGLVLFASFSLGLAPNVFSGFARADDMQAFQADAAKHWTFELSASILDFRLKQCHAASAEARSLYAKEIQQLTAEYSVLTHQPFQLPSCGDL